MVSGAVAVPLVVPRQQFIESGLPKGVIDTNTGMESNYGGPPGEARSE